MGFFDGIVSAITAPVASVVGGLAGGFGQAQTNQKNWDIAQSQNQTSQAMQEDSQSFNADQARIDREFQASQADTSRSWSAQQAQIGRDYTTQMSNTAYQRAVGDLVAAGLNPMLAVSQGGASTPSAVVGQSAQASGSRASSGQGHASSVAPMGNVAQSAISGAAQVANVMNAKEQNELLKAQIFQTDAMSDKIRAETANALDENPYIRSKYGNIIADTAVKGTIARMNTAQTAHTYQGININKPLEEYTSKFGQLSPALKDLGNLGNFIRMITR